MALTLNYKVALENLIEALHALNDMLIKMIRQK